MNEYNDDRLEKVSSLASRVLDIARNTLIIKLRFLDKAINMLMLEESSLFPLAVDGKNLIILKQAQTGMNMQRNHLIQRID